AAGQAGPGRLGLVADLARAARPGPPARRNGRARRACRVGRNGRIGRIDRVGPVELPVPTTRGTDRMLDPDLIRELLSEALSTGGRFAELFAEERDSTSLRLDDGRIEEVVSGSDRGAGIRVFHGESQAYAFSNRLDAESLRGVARAA